MLSFYFVLHFREDLEKMGTSLIENAEKGTEKDRESRLQPRREVNSSMSGFELISENEKKVITYLPH